MTTADGEIYICDFGRIEYVDIFRAEVSGTRIPLSRERARAAGWQDLFLERVDAYEPGEFGCVISFGNSGGDCGGTAEIDKKLAEFPGAVTRAGVARARVFTDARLWYDAIDAYNALIERFPDRAELYERRGTIYAQLTCTQSLAEEDLARAERMQAMKRSRKFLPRISRRKISDSKILVAPTGIEPVLPP